MDQVASPTEEALAHDETLRQLSRQHSELESQLETLRTRRFLSAEEEVEELRLKKLKLHVKDEIAQLRHGS